MLKDTKADKKGIDITFWVKNLVICLLLTVGILFLTAVLAVVVNLQAAAVSLVVSVVTYLCVGISGFRAARHSGSNGLLSGGIAGFFYTIVLYLIGCAAFGEFSFGTSVLLTLVICTLCGAVGGVIGVNLGMKKRR